MQQFCTQAVDIDTALKKENLVNYLLEMPPIPYQTIDWNTIPQTEHPGTTGTSFWKTIQLPGIRLRMVEYSKDYLADHWCQKGHIVHCLEGEFISEMENGDKTIMTKGMTYIVSDNLSSHRSISENGAILFITDGDFLQ